MQTNETNKQPIQILGYRLGEDRFGLPAEDVLRVVRAVEVTAVPGFPDGVLGVINVQGRVMPVISMRAKFHLPAKPVQTGDRFIIARAGARSVVLVADEVENLFELEAGSMTDNGWIFPSVPQFRGVVKLPDGLLLIHDLADLLSFEEGSLIDTVLASSDSAAA